MIRDKIYMWLQNRHEELIKWRGEHILSVDIKQDQEAMEYVPQELEGQILSSVHIHKHKNWYILNPNNMDSYITTADNVNEILPNQRELDYKLEIHTEDEEIRSEILSNRI